MQLTTTTSASVHAPATPVVLTKFVIVTLVVLTAPVCAGALVAPLLTFFAVQTQPVVAAGSVNTRGCEPEQDVPTLASENAAVPFAVIAPGDVQPPEATVGAVPRITGVEATR